MYEPDGSYGTAIRVTRWLKIAQKQQKNLSDQFGKKGQKYYILPIKG